MAYNVYGKHVPKDRAKWQALCATVSTYRFARELIAEGLILWSSGEEPAEHLLHRWAMEIEDGTEAADPALSQLMRVKLEHHKSNQHWQLVSDSIKAGRRLAKRIGTEESEKADGLNLSYTGAVANFGADKGEHMTKQTTSQTTNIGNVRIVSAHAQPKIPKASLIRARKWLAEGKPAQIVDAVAVKVLD